MGHAADDVAHLENRMSGRVTSLLFNGAASRAMLHPEGGGDEIEVTLPQSGEFATLARGDVVHIGWEGEQANAFAFDPGADALAGEG
jgi:spermidine/putrescine transport system ATP-binding protein